MNKCIITSDASYGREYPVKTKSAYIAAQHYRRFEGGEIVRVYAPRKGLISEARYIPGQGYVRVRV